MLGSVNDVDDLDGEECKARLSASLWASTDKDFKVFPFFLIVLSWKDVMGNTRSRGAILN